MKDQYSNVKSIGMDVHYKSSEVCMTDGEQNVVRRERLDHADRKRLREKVSRWPKGVPVVMESSYGWGWLSEELTACGLTVQLSNCYKVKRWAKIHGAVHNNKADARTQSLVAFEKGDWWKVWLPPPGVRDDRCYLHYRQDLVQTNVQLRNRIHAIMHENGILHEFSDLFGVGGRAFLKELAKTGRWQEVQLRDGALEALRGLLALWHDVRGAIAAADRRLRDLLENSPSTRRLDTLPGIGVILAHTIAAEVGTIRRFHGEGALSRYGLVAPEDNTTGDQDPSRGGMGQHVPRHGNVRLKWALVEAAQGAKRKSPRLARIYNAYTNGGRSRRQQGLVRIAHELARLVYLVLDREVDYQEPAEPSAPRRASKPSRRERLRKWLQTRSAAGQPSPAMAAVR